MQAFTHYEITFSTLHDVADPTSSSLLSFSFDFLYLQFNMPYAYQAADLSSRRFLRNSSSSSIFAPFGVYYLVPCDRHDECLLPVIYRSLFLFATHLRSSTRTSLFPLSVVPFVSPGPPPKRALINFLDGAHYRPDCRQIPTPRRDT